MATVAVRGTGTAYGTPDEASLSLRVESLRPTAAEALADVAERTKALVTHCHEGLRAFRDIRESLRRGRPQRLDA